MWYKNCFRRHLCDMHIDDWDKRFLSEFSPNAYVENLKKAKIQSAMLYFQSFVGLCYYPTKSGKMHNSFVGREDTMKRLVDLCHREGISVTGYYSLIHNTWAHDNFPEWRMVDKNGISAREKAAEDPSTEIAGGTAFARNGLCCPNNPGYRKYVLEQIREMSEYFSVEGMFYDMLYWPIMCCCDSCRKRWAEEVGGILPTEKEWSNKQWLLLMEKRREWMGEFAHLVTSVTKEKFGNISVEHNVAFSAHSDGTTANGEEVISACDYAGGDLYRDIYSQSFACKFYRSITKNQPFEHMFSRCAPNLGVHTQIKSYDIMKSDVFMAAANHGATLVIDAIDPVGTMDSRVYTQIGKVFEELIPYEPYLIGNAVEDIGLYYSLRSKFNPRGEPYTNYSGVVNTVTTLIENNILCGITGDFNDIAKYKVIVAPLLTEEDSQDNKRIFDYVRNGGSLYFSGADNAEMIEEFFGAEIVDYTEEKVIYLAPKETAQNAFDYFNKEYPLQFATSAPIIKGIRADHVIATLTLPYTTQNTVKFASIHSNPPGIKTDIPAMALINYGRGKVLWSAVPIESENFYEYGRIFTRLIKDMFGFEGTVRSDAPKDVEITLFRSGDSLLVNTVLLNTDFKARHVEDFKISITCDKQPKTLRIIPIEKEVPFAFDGRIITFESKNLNIFNMYRMDF